MTAAMMTHHGGDFRRISDWRYCKCGKRGAQGSDSEFESLGVVLSGHYSKSTVKAYSTGRLVHLIFFQFLPSCSLSLGVGGGGDKDFSFMTGHSTGIYSLNFEHLGVSTDSVDHHQSKFLWPKLKAVLFYGHTYLEGKSTDTSCPFSKTKAVVSLLEVFPIRDYDLLSHWAFDWVYRTRYEFLSVYHPSNLIGKPSVTSIIDSALLHQQAHLDWLAYIVM